RYRRAAPPGAGKSRKAVAACCHRLPHASSPDPVFMPRAAQAPVELSKSRARRIWLRAQRLDEAAPFGSGPDATKAAVEHLGYVQIDTINVIERCHHHILYTRIPEYRRS